jgi:hypothetical protein
MKDKKQKLDYGTQNYDGISRDQVAEILKELAAHGSAITGDNPWTVVTHEHGVVLRGEWNEAALVLSITVTAADWYVPRKTVWHNIDSLMHRIQDAG